MDRVKQCQWCGEIKPITEFYNHPTNKDGLFKMCKKCKKEYQKELARKKQANKKVEYKICGLCGKEKPVTEFLKYQSHYRNYCKECLPSVQSVPLKIRKIAEAHNFPANVLLEWSQSAIDCLEIGCNCHRCMISQTMKSKCKMKTAVKLLLQIHGKPDGYIEPTIIEEF